MQIEMDPFLEEINPILDFASISFPTKFLLFAHILLISKKKRILDLQIEE